jgi:hypothetical protein
MKKLQLLCASVALTLLLSVAAFADDGIILTGKSEPPPPPPPASDKMQSDPADTGGVITTGATSTDSSTDVAINLLQSVLALF